MGAATDVEVQLTSGCLVVDVQLCSGCLVVETAAEVEVQLGSGGLAVEAAIEVEDFHQWHIFTNSTWCYLLSFHKCISRAHSIRKFKTVVPNHSPFTPKASIA